MNRLQRHGGAVVPRPPVFALPAALALAAESLVALIARFSMAAVFWKSGQTKIEGFALDIVDGVFQPGLPRLSDTAVDLFRDEYRLPWLSPELAASAAAWGEHLLPAMLLLGLGTRVGALGLLGMTAVIQAFVYPDAYATHGTWAALLAWLALRGPGAISLDRVLECWLKRWNGAMETPR
jgi:putative oxidoreductase